MQYNKDFLFTTMENGIGIFKKHDDDAGIDFYLPEDITINPKCFVSVGLKVKTAFPNNYALILHDRSGLAHKKGIFTIGGVVDCNYRGEIHVCVVNIGDEVVTIKKGERVVQGVFTQVNPCRPTWITEDEYNKLEATTRGADGLGSTGTL